MKPKNTLILAPVGFAFPEFRSIQKNPVDLTNYFDGNTPDCIEKNVQFVIFVINQNNWEVG